MSFARALIVSLVPILLAASSALAADEPRKIDFTTVIVDAYGQPRVKECKVTLPPDAQGAPRPCPDDQIQYWTLGRACVSALEVGIEADKAQSAGAATARLMLQIKIADAETNKTPLALDSEQVTLILDRLAKVTASSVLIGRVAQLLDPARTK